MIYLDYQGTTPLAPDVALAMTEALPRFGNPHSAHSIGRQAAADVALARDRVLAALDVPAGQLVFTSGATEALNLAILGTARSAPIGRRRVITVATEHAAVLDTVRYLRHEGFDPVVLPVDGDGLVDLDIAAAAIDERAALLVIMQVNNEIGVCQPYDALVAIARDAGVPVICDAAQSFGRLPMPAGADMIAFSAHKIHGPKGIGALWLRQGVSVPPLMFGGGQQEGMRPGTLSPLLCVGFGVAAGRRREADLAHVEALWVHAGELFEGWQLNGPLDPAQRYHGNLSLRRDGLDAARLLSDCRTVAVSLGSACASGSGLPSHVLRAIGLNEAEARSTLRIGFGRYTTMAELEQAAGLLNKAAARQAAVPA
jgi:cysteine desulfurase